MKYKGILVLTMEAFLESIGITTDDVGVGHIEFKKNNDTIEVLLRSNERVIPIGDERRVLLEHVHEGYEIPRVNLEYACYQ